MPKTPATTLEETQPIAISLQEVALGISKTLRTLESLDKKITTIQSISLQIAEQISDEVSTEEISSDEEKMEEENLSPVQKKRKITKVPFKVQENEH